MMLSGTHRTYVQKTRRQSHNILESSRRFVCLRGWHHRQARKLRSMQSYEAVISDPTHVVYRYHEQLYRLALLLVGDADGAATLVERAYRQLVADMACSS